MGEPSACLRGLLGVLVVARGPGVATGFVNPLLADMKGLRRFLTLEATRELMRTRLRCSVVDLANPNPGRAVSELGKHVRVLLGVPAYPCDCFLRWAVDGFASPSVRQQIQLIDV